MKVFRRNGKPISCIRCGFEEACKRTGLEGFIFHDLRHTCVTNMRRAGVHDSIIMAITGHKTMVMFNRYNHVGRDELKTLWGKMGMAGQYLDSGSDTGSVNERP